MAGLVLNRTVVILINFCAKLNVCVSKSATSQSSKTLGATAELHSTDRTKYYEVVGSNSTLEQNPAPVTG